MAFPPPTGPEDERTELIDFMGTKYPFKVAVPPPERFDPAKARADTAALATGSLTPGLEPGTRAATASTRALDELALGIRPDQVLKDWQAGLPERGAPPAKPGTAAGLAERMDACMTPLLEGVRAELTRQAAAQRGHEDQLAAVAWLNQGARLAARAPGGLAEATAAKLGQALGDPGMGKIFLDKVAYYQVLGELERDAGQNLAADPRLAGVAPEILEDLEGDRRRLAREQGLSRQVAAARGRANFSQGLAGAFTAARRGEAGPAYAREQFLELYGPREGESRWQAYQASQAKAPAYALVRGRSQEEIAAAKAGYGGDWALLDQVEAEDAAERRRDPAGYGLAWAPGARAAYDQAGDPGEQAAILWEAQAAAGIPAPERSPWSGEQTTALAEGWLAIPDGPGAARARIDLLRHGLLGLPPEQRAAGQATLERMLSGDTRLGATLTALTDNRLGAAYAAAGANWQPVGAPGPVQLADSGQIVSDADPVPLQLAQTIPFPPTRPLLPGVGTPDNDGLARAIQGLPPAQGKSALIEPWDLRKTEPIAIVPPQALHADPGLRAAADLLARSGMTATEADAVIGELAALRGAGADLDLTQLAADYAALLPIGAGDAARQRQAVAGLSQAFQEIQTAGGQMTLAELALLERSPAYAEASGRGVVWVDDARQVVGSLVATPEPRQRVIETPDGLFFAVRHTDGRWRIEDFVLQGEPPKTQRAPDAPSAVAAAGMPDPDEEPRNATVYRSVNKKTGKVEYVGATRNFPLRRYYWARIRGYDVQRLNRLGDLTWSEARGVEQVLIEHHGLGRFGGTLANRIFSIGLRNPRYAELLRVGRDLLRSINYPGIE